MSRRTTLTLDADVAAKLDEEARGTGASFKETVNCVLREGLNQSRSRGTGKAFKVRARRLNARPGIDLDNIGDLLEQIEGPTHR